ncbi:MAG: hypothetical protein PHF35_04635 [Candidatus Moranbacteria bacterium]|nr:hypothetical protein [Candidatus Moranbacteria bacterium]
MVILALLNNFALQNYREEVFNRVNFTFPILSNFPTPGKPKTGDIPAYINLENSIRALSPILRQIFPGAEAFGYPQNMARYLSGSDLAPWLIDKTRIFLKIIPAAFRKKK